MERAAPFSPAHRAPRCLPIWSCSVRGFACHRCHHRRGALLPHLFTIATLAGSAVCFLCHFPSGRPDRTLSGALPCGVRTFLSPCGKRSSGSLRTFILTGGTGGTAWVGGPFTASRPLAVRLLRNLILLEFLVEIAPRRVDDFGGFRDVPAVLAEFPDQERALGVVFELAQRPRPRGVRIARRLRRDRRARRSHDVRQIRDVDGVAAGHDDQALHRIAQLADVALPAVPLQRLDRRRRDALRADVVLAAEIVHVVPDEERDVVDALAQRRHVNRDDREPEIQVFAEATLLDFFLEILVRGGDDADVYFDRPRGSEALDFAFLQHAQDLGLRLRAHVADFVEENRSAIRLFELADLLFRRAGERPLFVPEQLALDQVLGNGGAIHLHEPLAAAQTVAVDRPRDELLADAALALNQHRRVGGRRAADRRHDVLEPGAVADHLMPDFDRLLERPVLVAQLPLVEGVAQRDEHLFGRERLLDEIERPLVRRLERRARRAVPRDDDD